MSKIILILCLKVILFTSISGYACEKALKNRLQATILKSDTLGIEVSNLRVHGLTLSEVEEAELRQVLRDQHSYLANLPGDFTVDYESDILEQIEVKIAYEIHCKDGTCVLRSLNPQSVPESERASLQSAADRVFEILTSSWKRSMGSLFFSIELRHKFEMTILVTRSEF